MSMWKKRPDNIWVLELPAMTVAIKKKGPATFSMLGRYSEEYATLAEAQKAGLKQAKVTLEGRQTDIDRSLIRIEALLTGNDHEHDGA